MKYDELITELENLKKRPDITNEISVVLDTLHICLRLENSQLIEELSLACARVAYSKALPVIQEIMEKNLSEQ